MNEEAGFIKALLADPDDRTVLLVYADWLDEHDDPRGEYLRLLAAEQPDRSHLHLVGNTLERTWVDFISSRTSFRVGDRVRILDGPLANVQGVFVGVVAGRGDEVVPYPDSRPWNAVVQVVLSGRLLQAEIRWWCFEQVDDAQV